MCKLNISNKFKRGGFKSRANEYEMNRAVYSHHAFSLKLSAQLKA